MTKLNELQRQLLEAANADGGAAAPDVPKAKTAIKALIKAGYLISVPVDDAASQLLITSEGRRAIGVEDTTAEVSGQPAPPAPETSAPVPKSAAEGRVSKLDVVVGLLGSPDGATVEAMMAATGWQAHSVRGAISGALKKGRNFEISSEKTEGGRVYRIVEAARG